MDIRLIIICELGILSFTIVTLMPRSNSIRRFRYRLIYKSGLWNGKNCVRLQLLSAIDHECIDEDSVTEITIVEEEDEFEYNDLF